jgi:AcrR family transcriptional regulator
MSRPSIENIDEKIIASTIELGGARDPKTDFSTRSIASASGCSEFLIFSHFTSKNNLLEKADVFVHSAIADEMEVIEKSHPTLHEYIMSLLDWLITHPSYTIFALRYGHGLPHPNPNGYDDHAYDDIRMRLFATGYHWFHSSQREERFFFLVYSMNQLIFDASYIIYGSHEDTPEHRENLVSEIIYGLDSLQKEGVGV